MAQKILITNFTFHISAEELEKLTLEIAPAFCDVPGLIWKIYIMDREKRQAGGVYLFKDDDALQSFKLSPLVASILSHPSLSNFELTERDVLEGPSEINFAPLKSRNVLAES